MTHLLTAAEVAERLQLPTSWVYAAARDGRLPCLKLGRYTRFDPEQVKAWLAAQKGTPRA
jgi:excisionase family DNA binding protein